MMGAINFVRVFLAVTCCSAVLSVELMREKPAQDIHIFKFTLPSKSKVSVLAKRRFRRDANPDDPDVYNVHEEQGKCIIPSDSNGRTLNTTDVSLSCRLYVITMHPVLITWLCLRKFRLNLFAIFQWKFENETKVSISMAWIGKKSSGEAEVRVFVLLTVKLPASRTMKT